MEQQLASASPPSSSHYYFFAFSLFFAVSWKWAALVARPTTKENGFFFTVSDCRSALACKCFAREEQKKQKTSLRQEKKTQCVFAESDLSSMTLWSRIYLKMRATWNPEGVWPDSLMSHFNSKWWLTSSFDWLSDSHFQDSRYIYTLWCEFHL